MAVAGLVACTAAAGSTLVLTPAGDIYGLSGATVGWGFTITNTVSNWIEVTSAAFCTGTSGTNTLCTVATIGTFTDYISGYNDIVVGPSPDSTSVTQAFGNVAHTGIGSFLITAASGQTGPGQIVLTYNVFSRSPHDAAFNPDTDTVSTDNFLTASASVTVASAPVPTVPTLSQWGMVLLAGLLAAAAALELHRRTRRRAGASATRY
jgi:hypothetical protein